MYHIYDTYIKIHENKINIYSSSTNLHYTDAKKYSYSVKYSYLKLKRKPGEDNKEFFLYNS